MSVADRPPYSLQNLYIVQALFPHLIFQPEIPCKKEKKTNIAASGIMYGIAYIRLSLKMLVFLQPIAASQSRSVTSLHFSSSAVFLSALSKNVNKVSQCCGYSAVASIWGTGARAPSTSNNFHFSSLWSKSGSQLFKYCVQSARSAGADVNNSQLFQSVPHQSSSSCCTQP